MGVEGRRALQEIELLGVLAVSGAGESANGDIIDTSRRVEKTEKNRHVIWAAVHGIEASTDRGRAETVDEGGMLPRSET